MKINKYSLVASGLLVLGTGLVFGALAYGQLRETPFAVPTVAAQEITYLDFTAGKLETESNLVKESGRATNSSLAVETKAQIAPTHGVKITNQTDLEVDSEALLNLNLQIRQEIAQIAPDLLLDAGNSELLILNLQLFDQEAFVKTATDGANYETRGGMIKKDGQRYINLATDRFTQNWTTKFEEISTENEWILGNGQELLTMILVHELIHFNTDFANTSREEAEAFAHQYDAAWTNQLKPILFKL